MKHYIHGGDIYRNDIKADHSVSINPCKWPKDLDDKIRSILSDECLVYTYPDAFNEDLKRMIAQYEHTEAKNVVCGNGASEIISAICNRIRPKRVLLTAPCYSGYERAIRAAGGEVSYVLQDESKGFTDHETVCKALGGGNPFLQGVDMVIVTNPSNPTGQLMDPAVLKELIDICDSQGIILISDESFMDLSLTRAQYEKLYGGYKSNYLIRLKALTKSHRLAGIRLGYAISDNENFIEIIEEILPEWNISGIAAGVGKACLEYELNNPECGYLKHSLDYINDERIRMADELKKLGIMVYESVSCYLLLYTQTELYEELKKRRILIRDCDDIYGLRHGFYRISIKSKSEDDELLRNIKDIYEQD